jgi:predicted PurR-regulated permease PerM
MPLNIRNVGISIVAAAALLAMLKLAQAVIIPFILSGLLFYALDPLIARLQRWHVPRALSAALALLLCIGAVGGGIYSLADDVMAVVTQLPAGVRKFQTDFRRPSTDVGAIDSVQRTARAIDQAAADAATPSAVPKGVVRVQVEEPALRTSDYIWSGSIGAVALAGQALMILFLTYFLLVADDLFKRKLVKYMGPTLAKKRLTVEIVDEIGVQIQRFLLVQILTSVLVAVVTTIALSALGLEQPIVWGLAAGVLNSVPYFGAIIVTAGLAIVGFVQFGTLAMAGTVAGIALLITTLEGMLLTPTLMGRIGRLNHIAIFASLLFWSWMWGVMGLLLAVPILMVAKAVCDRVEELQPVADFLSE